MKKLINKAGARHLTLSQNQIDYILSNYIERNGIVFKFSKKTGMYKPASQWNDGNYYYTTITNKRVALNKNYKIHKLVWLLNHREEAQGNIDHINGEKLQNNIDNLRIASCSQNTRNAGTTVASTTGLKGVYQNGKKYIVQITLETGKLKTIGRFDDLFKAAVAFNEACEKYLSAEILAFQRMNNI